jgi:glycosyltransferase involved in cell wall biosynthesis
VTIKVSVVVPVKNEERQLGTCLSQLKRFAEIIVIDSGSTDATVALASLHGAQVLNFQWNGQFPKKRNWFLLNQAPQCEWVLFLDADEIVNDDFCNAVEAAISHHAYVGYWLNYTTYFKGKILQYGVPQKKLALFKVGVGLYEKIDEQQWSILDMEIHEHPILNGPVGEIAAKIDHNDDRGLNKFIEKHIQYAAWEARRFMDLQKGKTPVLTPRQKFKYAHIAKWWFASFYFAYSYGVKLGFLDGAAGLQYAYYKAWYFAKIRTSIRHLQAPQ